MVARREIVEQLSKELSLPYIGAEQDWEIEMADSSRISDFFTFYHQNNISDERKVAIMSLLLASYDDYLNENELEIDDRWNDIKFVLESDSKLFIELIDYWSMTNEVEVDNLFRITPLIRKVILGC